jgi:hypothetical protein
MQFTLFALGKPNNQLYSTPHQNISAGPRLEISIKNLVGLIAVTDKSINTKIVKGPLELAKHHPQLAHDPSGINY